MRTARRKTLSELNNARVQGGGHGEESAMRKLSALGASGKHAGANRTHQGKPSSSQRRHSVYYSNGQTPRVDPRPLGDKAYINSCVRQLISFLSSRGFDSALSPKTLASPTAKEFAALSLFLFRQADENFKFGSKTEDDVPTVFKQLRYPFQISKSALYAVGSPHTWPSLLTALTWLVQIYIYEEETERNEAKVNSSPRPHCLVNNAFETNARDVQLSPAQACLFGALRALTLDVSACRRYHALMPTCLSSNT